MRGQPGAEDGVSVIVGTLLLILITVTAAAGLALMVSQLQKDEMNRQSHQAQVKNEELKIVSLSMSENATIGSWDNASIGILNLNTADSRVVTLGLNDRYAWNFSVNGTYYNLTRNEHLRIDATEGLVVFVNMSGDFLPAGQPLRIGTGEAVRVRVMTSLYNTFERTFQPPVAVARAAMETENLGVVSRDVLELDGSDSYDDGTVTLWNWTVDDGSNTYPMPGNWSDPNVTSRNYAGKMTRISPGSAGPLRVILSVTDDTGMTGKSAGITIPGNPRFNPPASLSVETLVIDANQTLIRARISDMAGNPVNNTAVTFLVKPGTDIYGNLTLNRTMGYSLPDGTAAAMKVQGSGIVIVGSGTLPSREVIV